MFFKIIDFHLLWDVLKKHLSIMHPLANNSSQVTLGSLHLSIRLSSQLFFYTAALRLVNIFSLTIKINQSISDVYYENIVQ